MTIQFYKYHGTGNDFILLDNRNNEYSLLTNEQIAHMCHRRFGIGADGLMLLQNHDKYDFEMKYYNSDGYIGTMCGNGGRCITSFAKKLGIIKNETAFVASDGIHQAKIDENNVVELRMQDVKNVVTDTEDFFLNTGSPHHVTFVKNLKDFDVLNEGKKIIHSLKYAPNGTNVNFVEIFNDHIFVRTFERGVEDETLSCGTGSVASAIATFLKTTVYTPVTKIKTLGGNLSVKFDYQENMFKNIFLTGKAETSFNGIFII